MMLPAISIRQPWAWCIINAGKDVENRTWPLPKKYLNTPVLIHAGKTADEDAVDFLDCIGMIQSGCPTPDTYPKGGIVGALVFNCCKPSGSEWAEPGLYHWGIRNAVPLPFFACKGRLGFFTVDYTPHRELNLWLKQLSDGAAS